MTEKLPPLPPPEQLLPVIEHEMFARNIAVGMTRPKAFDDIGLGKLAPPKKKEIADMPEVVQRIAFLQKKEITARRALITKEANEVGDVSTEKALKKLKITKAYLLSHLQQNIVLAQEIGQISASNKAIAMLWSVLMEGDTRDPDGRRNDNKLPDVNLSVLLDFAKEMSKPSTIQVVPENDIGFNRESDLADYEEVKE
jgi:hypothetical protein